MVLASSQRFEIGIVIVNFRTPQLVEACLDSIESQLEENNAGVVVVDNDSGDGSYDRLRKYCQSMKVADRINVIAAPHNNGFSAGNNIGVREISANYILFLNSDAIAKPTALSSLREAVRKDAAADIFTPCIVSSSGEVQISRFRNHTILGEFLDAAHTGLLTRIFQWAEVPIFEGSAFATPQWVSFSAVMIKSEAIDRAGPMDEGFFLYFEDCDYCRRIVSKAHSICYVGAAEFQHDEGGSTNLRQQEENLTRLPSYYYRSRARYFAKYYGPLGPVLANFAWYLGRLFTRARAIVGRPAPALCEGRSKDIWIGWRGA